MEKIKILLKYIDTLSEWSGRIFQWLGILIVVIVVYNVTLRYAFHAPTLWGFEITYFLYGAFFMLGGAYTLLHKAHVRVDVFYSRLSPRARGIIDSLGYLVLFFFFFGTMMWSGIDFASTSWAVREHTVSAWAPPLYPLKTVIPVAFSLLLLQGLAEFIRSLILAIKGVEI